MKEKHDYAITIIILDNMSNAHYRYHQNRTSNTLSGNSLSIEVITRTSNTSSIKNSKNDNYIIPTHHYNKAVSRIVEVQTILSIKTLDNLFSDIDTMI